MYPHEIRMAAEAGKPWAVRLVAVQATRARYAAAASRIGRLAQEWYSEGDNERVGRACDWLSALIEARDGALESAGFSAK